MSERGLWLLPARDASRETALEAGYMRRRLAPVRAQACGETRVARHRDERRQAMAWAFLKPLARDTMTPAGVTHRTGSCDWQNRLRTRFCRPRQPRWPKARANRGAMLRLGDFPHPSELGRCHAVIRSLGQTDETLAEFQRGRVPEAAPTRQVTRLDDTGATPCIEF